MGKKLLNTFVISKSKTSTFSGRLNQKLAKVEGMDSYLVNKCIYNIHNMCEEIIHHSNTMTNQPLFY